MLFSATFPKPARDLAKAHLSPAYVRIRVGRAGSTHKNIVQSVVLVEEYQKKQVLVDILKDLPPCRIIIFVNSKRTAEEVDDFLYNLGLPSTSMHSDRTQLEREDALRAFKRGKAPILIATGVSARGIDVPNVPYVINYDMPSMEHGGIEEYVHRIGKSGCFDFPFLVRTAFGASGPFSDSSLLFYTLAQVVPDVLAIVATPSRFTIRSGMSPSPAFSRARC